MTKETFTFMMTKLGAALWQIEDSIRYVEDLCFGDAEQKREMYLDEYRLAKEENDYFAA